MTRRKKDDFPASSQRLFTLMDSLMAQLHTNSEAYAFALEILTLLNQTVACKACSGRGSREKHKQCHHDTHDSYVLGCYDRVRCRDCHGIGRVPLTSGGV